jgi:cell wall-associated NlpC family hydrolase
MLTIITLLSHFLKNKAATTLILLIIALASPSCVSIAGGGIASKASSWEGGHYKKGRTRQCSNWVAEVVRSSGESPPKGYAKASSWIKWGKPVSLSTAQGGDVIILQNTYKSGVSHVGIYIGNGMMIHRSTHSSPVKKVSLKSGYYKNKVHSVRRLSPS